MSYGVATQTGVSVAIQSIPSFMSNKGLRNGYGATFAENFADGTNTLDPRITFSRASNATVTNSSGNIVYAPMNLLTYSEQFDNAAWTKTTTTVAANSFVAPSGNTTADTLTASGANSTTLQTFTAIASPYTFSVYLYRKTGTGNIDITVDGTTWVTKTITAGWTRVETNLTPTAGSKTAGIRIVTNGDAVYIWGAQLELRSSASTYNPTTVKNLLGYSEAFDNAAWTKTATTITANSIAAPNGTTTADTLVENTANTGHRLQLAATVVSGTPITVSIYAKASGRTRFDLFEAFTSKGASFNLSTVSTSAPQTTGVTAATSSSITDVGNGWYRCSFVVTTSGTSASLSILLSDGTTTVYTGNGTSGIYIWGAQLSDSASLDPYVNNPVAAPSAAAYYGARFDYDPVTLQPKGLLIEEQRTNLLVRSEEFDSATWLKSGTSITANAIIAPDGTLNGDRIVETATTGVHTVAQAINLTSGVAYTASVYAKADQRSFLIIQPFGTSVFAYFNLSTGTVGTLSGSPTATSIQAVGNGWYRCTITATAASTGSANIIIYCAASDGNATYTGNGTSGIYVWGAQLEAGAFATSYIPTVASQVTRSADNALIQGSNFSGFYNQSEGTFSIQADVASITSSGNIFLAMANDNTYNNDVGLLLPSSGGTGRLLTNSGGTFNGLAVSLNAVTVNVPFKLAGAYKTNDLSVSLNGQAVGVDSTATIPSALTRLDIGSDQTGANRVGSGHIRQLAYYPTRLQNSQLQAITQ